MREIKDIIIGGYNPNIETTEEAEVDMYEEAKGHEEGTAGRQPDEQGDDKMDGADDVEMEEAPDWSPDDTIGQPEQDVAEVEDDDDESDDNITPLERVIALSEVGDRAEGELRIGGFDPTDVGPRSKYELSQIVDAAVLQDGDYYMTCKEADNRTPDRINIGHPGYRQLVPGT